MIAQVTSEMESTGISIPSLDLQFLLNDIALIDFAFGMALNRLIM